MLCEAVGQFFPTPPEGGEKLGTKTIGTVVAEGTRTTYIVPGRESGNGQALQPRHRTVRTLAGYVPQYSNLRAVLNYP